VRYGRGAVLAWIAYTLGFVAGRAFRRPVGPDVWHDAPPDALAVVLVDRVTSWPPAAIHTERDASSTSGRD